MSVILDALRKSESERRRASVPGISHVPLVVERPRLPTWAIAVMATLGASAVLMTGAWWYALEAREGTAPATADARREPLPLPAPEMPAARPRPASPASGAPPRAGAAALRSAASAAAPAPLERASPEPPSPPAGGVAPPHAARPTTASAETAAPTATAADLRARGASIPDLRLELHVYGSTPTDRYVFINGKMYREGETLREGPELVSIDARGATLRYDGQVFLLTQ